MKSLCVLQSFTLIYKIKYLHSRYSSENLSMDRINSAPIQKPRWRRLIFRGKTDGATNSMTPYPPPTAPLVGFRPAAGRGPALPEPPPPPGPAPAHAPPGPVPADSSDSGEPGRSTWAALLGLLHNCGWRYFSQGSLNKDSRDQFLLEFSSRKCLVSADVYMLPVVGTGQLYNSVFLFLTWATRKREIKYIAQVSQHWQMGILNSSTSFRWGWFYFL